MSILFVDANIFLEVQLGQAKVDQCKVFLNYVSLHQIKIIISSFLLFSIILVIETKTGDLTKVKRFIQSMNSFRTLKVYNPPVHILLSAVDAQQRLGLDFDDGLVIGCMFGLNVKYLVTFDSHFDNVSEIIALTPEEAVRMLESEK